MVYFAVGSYAINESNRDVIARPEAQLQQGEHRAESDVDGQRSFFNIQLATFLKVFPPPFVSSAWMILIQSVWCAGQRTLPKGS